MKEQHPVTLALVGAGYWGNKLLPKLLKSGAIVRVICDTHPGNLAEIEKQFPQIGTTQAFDDVLKDADIEAVLIVTPPATHFVLARQALRAKKHVWIEKPLALRLQEGRELLELAKTEERVLFVDHTFLYDSAVVLIRTLIRNGELGDIHHLYLQRSNLGRIKRDSNVWWNSAPHDASLLLFLLSALPRSINLQGYWYLQPNVEDLTIAVVELTGGASAFIYDTWLYPENSAKLTVIGSKGFLVYEGKFDKRSITTYKYHLDGPPKGLEHGHDPPTTIPATLLAQERLQVFPGLEPLQAALADFLESIEQRRQPLSSGEFALKVLAVLEAGERSLRANGERTEIRFDF
jgi:UDP-2-acetamido-3-amino-2,3-dideoxy-glucuronate N-acetyltransferase